MKTAALTLVALLALAGCGNEETLAPLDAGADAGDGGTEPPDAGVDGGPVVRTVLTRDPLGHDPSSLFVDGDFELSTQGETGLQLGWRSFNATGTAEDVTKTETGGLCRSGLRCAILEADQLMLVRGAAAPHSQPMTMSVWAKVPTCSTLTNIAILCDTSAALVELQTKGTHDAAGYCNYTAQIAAQNMSICLYIESTLTGSQTALVDDAELTIDSGKQTDALQVAQVAPATLARIQRLTTFVRGSMRVGRSPRKHERNPH